MSDHPTNDQQFLERMRVDTSAFDEFFNMYYDAIIGYVIKRTSNVAVAEDITSEVFMKALKALPTYEWRGIPIKAWIYTIANNEVKMYYRKHKYQSSLDELYESTNFEPASSIDLEQELIDSQDRIDRDAQYQQALILIKDLPIKYQEVMTLRYGEDMKIAEIAVILDKKEGTVKSLLSRSLRKIEKQLRKSTQPNASNGITILDNTKDHSL